MLPSDNNTIERAIRHFLDDGTETPTNIPVVDLEDPSKVVWSSDKTFVPVATWKTLRYLTGVLER